MTQDYNADTMRAQNESLLQAEKDLTAQKLTDASNNPGEYGFRPATDRDAHLLAELAAGRAVWGTL